MGILLPRFIQDVMISEKRGIVNAFLRFMRLKTACRTWRRGFFARRGKQLPGH
jgi:hypothetical protein